MHQKSVNYLRSEEGSKDVANKATNTVDGEDVESIIAAKEVLQLGCIVACNATNSTEDNSNPAQLNLHLRYRAADSSYI